MAAIFDPLGNAVHTALAFPVLGEDVLVCGAGPSGCMATAVARHAGARHVVVSEPNAFRRELAVRMGATVAIDPAMTALDEVFESLAMVEGYDVALEMSGNPTALRSAIRAMAHGGGIAVLGLPAAEVTLDLGEVVLKMLTIRGIYGREMYETWYKMTVMLLSGLDVAPAITHRFAFEEHEAAFAAARSRRVGQGDHGLGAVTAATPIGGDRPDPLAFLEAEVAALREKHLYRSLRVMTSAQGPVVDVDGRRLVSLSSNDYLGLTHHPRLMEAALAAVADFGVGSGAVRTIAGTMAVHEALEAELAEFKGVPAVLTFQSGFTANTGLIPTITGATTSSCPTPSTTPRSSTACACRRRPAASTPTPTSTRCGRSSSRGRRPSGGATG